VAANDPAKANASAPEIEATQRRFTVQRQLRRLVALHPRRVGALLIRTYNEWSEDAASRLGAALAYYTLFSVAPLLIVLTGIAGIFVGKAAAQAQLSPWLQRFLSPEGAHAAELMLAQHVTPTGGIITTVIGAIGLFLGTAAFINELRQSLNIVWRVPTPASTATGAVAVVRSLLTDRIHGFLIAVGAAVLTVVSLGSNAALSVIRSRFDGVLPVPATLLQATNVALSVLLLGIMFTLIYKVIPDAFIAWGDAAVGGVVTAVLFNVGDLLLSIFVGQASRSVYGTAASVLALLAWVYYSAQVFLFGAELTRIFATEHGGGIVPVDPQRWWRRNRPPGAVGTLASSPPRA
jgi:membrane protein